MSSGAVPDSRANPDRGKRGGGVVDSAAPTALHVHEWPDKATTAFLKAAALQTGKTLTVYCKCGAERVVT